LTQIRTASASIVGQRDFNGDGTYDLLWRDTNGDTSIWFMIGTQVFSSAAVGNVGARGPSPARRISMATARATFSGGTAAAIPRCG
jgi:hypothetical protein